MPGMMSAPALHDLLSDYKDKDEVITENKNKPKPEKVKTDTLYEHACKGHPHDPLCPACVRARMTAKSNTKNDGLYKLNKDQTNHRDVPNRLMNKKDTDIEHLTQSWVSKSKDKKNIKRDKLSAKQWVMMMMLSYMLGMPGMMSAPALHDLLSDYKDKDEVITENKNKPKPEKVKTCLLYTSPSPRDRTRSRMPSSA